jgi:hypothetical protein
LNYCVPNTETKGRKNPAFALPFPAPYTLSQVETGSITTET